MTGLDPALVEKAAEAMVHLRWPTTEPIQDGDREVARTMLDAVAPAIREAALNEALAQLRVRWVTSAATGDYNGGLSGAIAIVRDMAAQQREEQADGLE